MTPTIDLIKNHRSIRKFTNEPITQEQLNEIIIASKQASTSSHLQCVSIMRITDKELRSKIAHLSGQQSYIATAAEFLIFCADFHRHQCIVKEGQFGFIEQLILGCIDSGLMGQNALLAAESQGLGGVFIGAVRNNPVAIATLLSLPELVFPLFGLCLGHPDQNPTIKPRLPTSVIVHDNQYQPLAMPEIKRFDEQVKTYYQQRTGNKKHSTWSEQMQHKLQQESRPFMHSALKQYGYAKR